MYSSNEDHLMLESGDEDVLSDTDYISSSSNKLREGDLYFDEIIGHIEDLIMDEQFHQMQNSFLEKHWTEFDDQEENKLIYMDIFKQYEEVIENYIDRHLTERLDGFNMEEFLQNLQNRYQNNGESDQMEGEIFEMLLTFTDFLRFKQMFLDYRAMKEGKYEEFQSTIQIIGLLPPSTTKQVIL